MKLSYDSEDDNLLIGIKITLFKPDDNTVTDQAVNEKIKALECKINETIQHIDRYGFYDDEYKKLVSDSIYSFFSKAFSADERKNEDVLTEMSDDLINEIVSYSKP